MSVCLPFSVINVHEESLHLLTDTADCFPFSGSLSKWSQKQQEQMLVVVFPGVSVVYRDAQFLLPLFLSLQFIGWPLIFLSSCSLEHMCWMASTIHGTCTLHTVCLILYQYIIIIFLSLISSVALSMSGMFLRLGLLL